MSTSFSAVQPGKHPSLVDIFSRHRELLQKLPVASAILSHGFFRCGDRANPTAKSREAAAGIKCQLILVRVQVAPNYPRPSGEAAYALGV